VSVARLPYADPLSGEGARILEEVERTRGQVLNLFRAMLHAPAVAGPWVELGTALRYRTSLADRTRELAIAQVAARTASPYEWHHHAPLAAAAGVGEALLSALPDWSSEVTDDQGDRELLTYIDQVLDGAVEDASYAAVEKRFGRQEAVEITATAAFYLCIARFLSALDIDIEAPE
jgi:alkylhydroperoxidase family enzyme